MTGSWLLSIVATGKTFGALYDVLHHIVNEQKKSALKLTFFVVVLPGFEPGQTEPKPVVLPLHHRTILHRSLSKSVAKV